jgi:hypothetical protein
MGTRRKKAAHVTGFKEKLSALHTEMLVRVMREGEIDPASLGEVLEDMGNQFLDLADDIRARILAANQSKAPASGSGQAADGNQH